MKSSEYSISLDRELRQAKKLAAAAASRGCQLKPDGNKGYSAPTSGEAYSFGSLQHSGISISQHEDYSTDDFLVRFVVEIHIDPFMLDKDEWN